MRHHVRMKLVPNYHVRTNVPKKLNNFIIIEIVSYVCFSRDTHLFLNDLDDFDFLRSRSGGGVTTGVAWNWWQVVLLGWAWWWQVASCLRGWCTVRWCWCAINWFRGTVCWCGSTISWCWLLIWISRISWKMTGRSNACKSDNTDKYLRAHRKQFNLIKYSTFNM